MKIAVYCIAKNEEQFVARCCTSAADADYIVIADTGSTDGTVAEARRYATHVHEICISPWRFDRARDAALALVPADVDVCIALDLDEVLEPGWREEIERVWTPETTRMRYLFDWGKGIRFYSEKIHARRGYSWHHPVHEYPRPDKRITEVYAFSEMLLVTHHPDDTKSRGQYLDLLKMSIEEDPHCPRNAFYYARELTYYGEWYAAIEALQRYLLMPEATWDNERSFAMRLLGRAHEETGDPEKALYWYRRACAEDPTVRDPWVDLAGACSRGKRWHECYGAAMTALGITERKMLHTCDPAAWGHKPHDYAAMAAYYLGRYEEACEHGAKALEIDPSNARLAANMSYYLKAA